jgi:pyruvate formate lyase activating enzyme
MAHSDAGPHGLILRLERSSIHDGKGLRTVVFLKGCPLKCQWCSTPESQNASVEEAGGTVYGRWMSVEETLAEIRKDSAFFFHSGGGVTVSGGEPLLQSDFVAELLCRAQEEGIHTIMESSFSGPVSNVAKVVPYLDMVFADLKIMDTEKHNMYCGGKNDEILNNIKYVSAREPPLELVVRVPLIPGVNDDPENLKRTGEFCASLNHLASVQLLPYHRLGTATYHKLGIQYKLPQVLPPAPERLRECREIIEQAISAARGSKGPAGKGKAVYRNEFRGMSKPQASEL